MSEPVVVLNSGGFDSTVLLNCVAHTHDISKHSTLK